MADCRKGGILIGEKTSKANTYPNEWLTLINIDFSLGVIVFLMSLKASSTEIIDTSLYPNKHNDIFFQKKLIQFLLISLWHKKCC